MRFNQLINNFSAGEWSPKMRGRTDVQQYTSACEELTNFIPQVQGGIFRRTPTRVVTNLSASAKASLATAVHNTNVKAKIIPYMTSQDDKVVLFAFDGAPNTYWFVLDSTSPNNGDTFVTASTAANYADSAAGIKYCQCGDFVFMCQNSTTAGYSPRIFYKSPGAWTLKNLIEYPTSEQWKSVPYREVQALGSSVNMTAGAATGTTTLTASAAFFNSGHVGAFFKLSAAGSTGVGYVTGYTSTTQVTISILSTVPTVACGTAAGTSWEESAWSDYRGWPRTVTAYQGRLIFGGNYTQPDTLWGSRIGNVLDFMERPFEQDTDFSTYTNDNSRPFTLTPNSKEASNIKALSSAKTLLIHTDRSEIVGYGVQGALGPNDFAFESSTSFGASSPMPTRTNNFSVFVEKGGRKLRDVIFNFNEDQYKSTDLAFPADHLTIDEDNGYGVTYDGTDKIVEICGFNQISSYVFAKTQNGRLLSLTLDRDYQINAWSRVVFGGKSELRDFPLTKAMAPVDTTETTTRVYFVNQRHINGTNVCNIEYMDLPWEPSTIPAQYYLYRYIYADMVSEYDYQTWNPSVLNRLYSLDHLKGQLVEVIADGAYIGEFTVTTAGELPSSHDWSQYTWIRAGLKYPSKVRTMPIELGQQVPGTPQGFIKRINEITIKYWNTYGLQYGTKDSNMTNIDFKDTAANMNDPVTLKSGYQKIKIESNYSEEVQVQLIQDKPWPCNITTIVCQGTTYD